jgi:hypothetical protein
MPGCGSHHVPHRHHGHGAHHVSVASACCGAARSTAEAPPRESEPTILKQRIRWLEREVEELRKQVRMKRQVV